MTSVTDKVATRTFNRPERLNALSRDLIFQSIGCLKEWGRDPEIGGIVVTGAGRTFCAGGDVLTMANEGDALNVGAPKAKELFFLSEIIDATEAHRIGLVNRVVSHENLSSQIIEIASRVAHGPLTSHR